MTVQFDMIKTSAWLRESVRQSSRGYMPQHVPHIDKVRDHSSEIYGYVLLCKLMSRLT